MPSRVAFATRRLLVRAIDSKHQEHHISDPRINERIRVPEVRLVGPSGEQVGIVSVEAALRLAREADLDLVEVAPGSRPPVAKIMDFGKFKYEQAQKAKEARRNQANTVLKEVRFRLKIDEHDYETKRKRAEGFLQDGDKVKAMILFRGREQSRPEMGVRLLQRFAEDIAEWGVVENRPTQDGRNMTMIVGPVRSKSDAKAEQNAARQAQREAEQEKRRLAAEEQAARQAAIEAQRPARAVEPVRETRAARLANQQASSRPSRGGRDRDRDDRPPRRDREDRAERSESREPREPRTPRQGSGSGAPQAPAARPGAAASAAARMLGAKPASAPSAAAAKPAADAPAPEKASPKKPAASAAKPAASAAKPAAPAAAKPAAKPAAPAAKPASK
ncbi:translation initiation factor IF-3 [Agrococcus sp. SGAir0287]|uniref:translation initiation factor IF-3 n=1 Tax=Agrococcus sp. SGAir0287 TaxID=2070347 RepID=UPI0020C7AC78|nr:translation initiation factor IF-3 [Agrococcus sp. SGAir0287]